MNWALDLLDKMTAKRASAPGGAAAADLAEGDPALIELVRQALTTVDDPEIGLNIVDLGLVYGLSVTPERIQVRIGLTSPSCPLSEHIARQARAAVKGAVGHDIPVGIDIDRDRRWSPDRVSPEARRLLGLR